MTGFKTRTTGIGSDRSTNWVTQPLPMYNYKVIVRECRYIWGLTLETERVKERARGRELGPRYWKTFPSKILLKLELKNERKKLHQPANQRTSQRLPIVLKSFSASFIHFEKGQNKSRGVEIFAQKLFGPTEEAQEQQQNVWRFWWLLKAALNDTKRTNERHFQNKIFVLLIALSTAAVPASSNS